MITTETLYITTPGQRPDIILAPYTVKDLGPYLPVRRETIPFEHAIAQDFYQMDPQKYIDSEADSITTSWGIFNEARLVGMVATCEEVDDNEVLLENQEEIGTILFDDEMRGLGIGTLAKIGLMAHGISERGIRQYGAWTSEQNLAAQRSLHKAGFTLTEKSKYHDYGDGVASEYWVLADMRGRPNIPFVTPPRTARFRKGWRRFARAFNELDIQKT
jgi:RimJ/RimL family protein N-acetyltransferase